MQETFEVMAQARTDTGKGASRRLRRAGLVPGIVYGAHKDPSMITVAQTDLVQHLGHEAFYSHVLDLKLGEAGERVVLKDLQRHPSKPLVLHVDFQRIAEDEKIRMHVPLHFVGEALAPGVKLGGGMISHSQTDVEITCLPKDLPEFIGVDVSQMQLGDMLHLSDLTLPDGVEIPALAQGPEHDLPVVALLAKHGGAAPGEAGEDGGETGAAG